MVRDSKATREYIATVIAETARHLQARPKPRVCSFTASWPWQKRLYCGDCEGMTCARFKKLGLDDNGEPLPHAERPKCGAITRQLFACGNRVVPGKERCRYHGGLSTGPKTSAGKERIAEAQRLRWAKLRAARDAGKAQG